MSMLYLILNFLGLCLILNYFLFVFNFEFFYLNFLGGKKTQNLKKKKKKPIKTRLKVGL